MSCLMWVIGPGVATIDSLEPEECHDCDYGCDYDNDYDYDYVAADDDYDDDDDDNNDDDDDKT